MVIDTMMNDTMPAVMRAFGDRLELLGVHCGLAGQANGGRTIAGHLGIFDQRTGRRHRGGSGFKLGEVQYRLGQHEPAGIGQLWIIVGNGGPVHRPG
jgi:hypothetical protein